jgi:hypothetical protein
MKLLDWWRKRKYEREQEARAIAEMRRADEPDTPEPPETYLSATRD